MYHWHGIHQDLNPARAKNVVQILEGLNNNNTVSKHQDPKELKILAIIPLKGKSIQINNNYLIERTIVAANKSELVTDTIVATDNEETALLAKDKDGVVQSFS